MSSSNRHSLALRVRTAAIGALLLALGCRSAALAADYAAQTHARQRLHQEQLQHALDLSLQQSAMRSRLQFAPAERARFEALANSQRMQQQHLHHQQLLRERHPIVDPAAAGLRRRLAAEESALQLQRFKLEQRSLVGAAPPPPLQPVRPPGALVLP